MTNLEFETELFALLHELRAKKCWGVCVVGEYFHMHFGKAILRTPIWLRNSKLPVELQDHQGEYQLFITAAAWRLRRHNRLLVTSSEVVYDDEDVDPKLQSLVGQTIVDIICNPVTYDLMVSFDKELVLEVFCCQSARDNYMVSQVGVRGVCVDAGLRLVSTDEAPEDRLPDE